MASVKDKTFRTKGRNATDGILLKGNVRELTGYRTATSIPSKFETILHTGNKERNGFNTRVYRFNENENELPGPGNYDIHGPSQEKLSQLTKVGGSVSKRGYSSMISKDFSTGFGTSKSLVPGAGTYNLKGMFEDAKPQAKCLFAGRTGQSYLSRDATPGPGDYEPFKSDTAPETGEKQKSGAAFLSRAIRLGTKKKIGPAPGAYEVTSDPVSAPVCPSSAFSSGVARDKTATEEFEKQSKLPGPMSYAATQKHHLGLHGSGTHMFTDKVAKGPFSFADPEIIEARLKEKYEGTPGPGTYFDQSDVRTKNPKARKPTLGGNFASTSKRIGYMEINKNPGPSFYKTPSTGKPLKKSFHLNTSGCWL